MEMKHYDALIWSFHMSFLIFDVNRSYSYSRYAARPLFPKIFSVCNVHVYFEMAVRFFIWWLFFSVYFHLYPFYYFIRFAYFEAWVSVVATSKLFSSKCMAKFCTASKAGLKLVCLCVVYGCNKNCAAE